HWPAMDCYVTVLQSLVIRAYFALHHVTFLFLMHRRPPTSPLFPYTTLFRSHPAGDAGYQDLRHQQGGRIARGGPGRWGEERGALDRRRPQARQGREDQDDARPEAVRVLAARRRAARRRDAGYRERRQGLPQRTCT